MKTRYWLHLHYTHLHLTSTKCALDDGARGAAAAASAPTILRKKRPITSFSLRIFAPVISSAQYHVVAATSSWLFPAWCLRLRHACGNAAADAYAATNVHAATAAASCSTSTSCSSAIDVPAIPAAISCEYGWPPRSSTAPSSSASSHATGSCSPGTCATLSL